MADLPLDVIADILSRLPVNPLLRFRCVSKSWCALIDSPHFTKLHLNRSIKSNTNRSIIYREYDLYSIDLDSLDYDAIELDHPFKNDDEETEVIGSCDGLLCLYLSHKDIALWNPSTKKHHKLPIDFPRKRLPTAYGFGYDSVGDDYKVVRLNGYSRGDDLFESDIKVYSLKSNSWGRIQDFPYRRKYMKNGILANGALHWIVCQRSESDTAKLIAAFDLGVEEFRLVPQPYYSDTDFEMSVEVLGRWLCVLCNYWWVCVDSCVDVWVMKEYGVEKSWTKLFSVAQRNTISSFDYVRPLCFSKSGGEVLLEWDGERFLWYDLKTKTIKNIEIHDLDFVMGVDICFGSLIPFRW